MDGLKLGSILNFFLCFGMHPKIIDVHPKLIPKGGVVQFCRSDIQIYVSWGTRLGPTIFNHADKITKKYLGLLQFKNAKRYLAE